MSLAVSVPLNAPHRSSARALFRRRKVVGLGLVLSLLTGAPAFPVIEISGRFFPTNTSTWTNGGNSGQNGALVGDANGPATLLLDDGSDLIFRDVIVGAGGFTGIATVTDSGTELNVNRDLIVGRQTGSTGTLSVLNGASLTTADEATLGLEAGASGTIVVSGVDSSWTVTNGILVGDLGIGSLTVSNGAQVSAGTMTLALGDGSSATFRLEGNGGVNDSRIDLTDSFIARANTDARVSNGGQLTVVEDFDIRSDFIVEGSGTLLSAGRDLLFSSSGAGETTPQLTVRDGAGLQSDDAKIGALNDSTANVTFTGGGTTWSVLSRLDIGNAASLQVGSGGTGVVELFDGAQLNAQVIFLGGEDTDSDQLTLRGVGTRVTTTEGFEIGNSGVLTVHPGSELRIGSELVLQEEGTVNLFVGDTTQISLSVNTSLSTPNANYQNEGTTNLFASAARAAGDYTPILPGDGFAIVNQGTFQAQGGSYDVSTGVLTIAPITTNPSGDLSGQRIRYNDLVVSFPDGVAAADFNVSRIFPSDIDENFLVAAYSFDTAITNTTIGLSVFLAKTATLDDLFFWHRADGSTEWTAVDADLIGVDGSYAVLLVDQFSDYAVTSTFVIPEPRVYGLLASLVALGLVWRRRSKPRE